MKWVGIIGLLLALALAVAWNFTYPHGAWRYRMTLHVETPEGAKTGSGVIEVQVRDGPTYNPEGAQSVWIHGDAVTVDLGSRGSLFALLKGDTGFEDYNKQIIFTVFPRPGGPGGETTKEGVAYYQSLQAKATLPVSDLPWLVRFKDINDPMSVERVDPADLSASFGPGVRLIKAEIEMTKDPVTRGIQTKLPWLDGLHGKYLDGASSSGDAPYDLHVGHFFKK